MHGIILLQVQDFSFPCVELHEIPGGPFLLLVKVALDGSAAV